MESRLYMPKGFESPHAVPYSLPLAAPFNFQQVYGNPMSVWRETYVSRRWWRVLDKAAPSLGLRGNMTMKELPFSVKASSLRCAAVSQRLLC